MPAARLVVAAAFAATALAAADESPRDVCAEASAQVSLEQFGMDGKEFTARGTWSAGGNAAGVLLEYRIDSDRMAAEARLGPGGTWETRIGGKPCGRKIFKVVAFPLAPDGSRDAVCMSKPAAQDANYLSECLAPVTLSECEWDCGDGPDAACVGRCLGAVATAEGKRFVPQVRVSGILFQTVDAPSPGPWWLNLNCSLGQKVAFRVREASGARDYSLPVEIDCGR
jgi:hypothetical protein